MRKRELGDGEEKFGVGAVVGSEGREVSATQPAGDLFVVRFFVRFPGLREHLRPRCRSAHKN